MRSASHPWRGIGAAALLLFAAGAANAQGQTPAASPKPSPVAERQEQRTLAIALRQFPADLNPLYASTPEAAFINGFLRRPVTAFDAKRQLVCILCTEIPTVENGKAQIQADGSMTVTFRLRPDARWGDGMPLTSRDVVFSWQALQTQPEALAPRPWASAISSVVAEDDTTFTVRWKQPRYDYNRLNDFPILPEHVERLAFRNTVAYRASSRFVLNPQDPGLGNGPYRLVQQEADTVVLAVSPTWWGEQKPWFRQIVLKRLPDRAAVASALEQGEVDLLPPGLSLRFEDITALQDSVPMPNSQVVYRPGTSFEHIALNLDHPALQDVRVRQALMYGLNREALNVFGLEKRFQVADSLIPVDDPAFGGAALPKYAFDPAKAAALLEAAGWTRGKDGGRYNAAGEKLTLTFTTSVRHPARGLIQQVARNFWRDLGVTILIDNVDQKTLTGKVLPERAFNSLILYSWNQAPQDVPWFALHSSAIPGAGTAVRGINFAGLRDPAMDAALAALMIETRAKKQQALWLRVQQLYLETLPGLPLYFRPAGGIVPKRLGGLTPYGHQTPVSLWAEGWFLKQDSGQPEVRIPF